MLKKEIVAGGTYRARVSGNFVTLRVDEIFQKEDLWSRKEVTRFNCTNLNTGRKIVVKSAAKFRFPVSV